MIRTPGQIERGSMEIIRAELQTRGITLPKENEAVILRCIHASADFDYAETLRFTPGAVRNAEDALRCGRDIVTDTNMALAGISKPGLQKLGGSAFSYMADERIAEHAKTEGTTRASGAILAIGNAPTALFRIREKMEEGLRPALVIAVPVGFVNVIESKEAVFEACESKGVPCIAAMGRKGGSSIAVAICNALIYSAAGLLEPTARGWN